MAKNLPPFVAYDARKPKSVSKICAGRARLLEKCMGNPALQQMVNERCRHDIVFWLNTFGWIFEPRQRKELPWITRPYQDDCLREMVRCIHDGENLHIYKTRDMGASWMGMAVMLHQCIFEPLSTFIAASHSADAVDASDNPNTLFWKLCFMIERLPSWMLDTKLVLSKRTLMHLFFPHNGSVINGETTSKRTGVGGRARMVWLDEFDKMEQCEAIFDSNQAVSDCVIACSALYGKGLHWKHGFTAEFQHLNRMYLHWIQCPAKAKDAYTTEGGDLKMIGRQPLPPGYQPILDGKVRSSYYDTQCKRFSSPSALAAEIDMNPEDAGGRYFPGSLIERCLAEHAKPATFTGFFDHDPATGEPRGFSHAPNGNLMLWCPLGMDNAPPKDDYVMGIDVSGGTGASNSVIAVYSKRLGEKVAEIAVADMLPERFAKYAVAMARWFNGAFMIWEANNHGHPFGHVVVKELGYRNIFYRESKGDSIAPQATTTYGFHTATGMGGNSKSTLFSIYRDALHGNTLINRSKPALEELSDYTMDEKGNPVSFKARANMDRKTGARTAHADRVQADAMVAMIVSPAIKDALKTKKDEARKIPPSCPAMRFKAHANRFSRTF